jgi:GntR family transcriptional regulator, transcriptional repressor for pyruvate dehydrogenase complex
VTIPAPAERPRVGESAVKSVADHVRSAIHRGDLSPGDCLPAERQMANQLGIARMTLRAALRKLQDEGYVTTTQRGSLGGTFVTELYAPTKRWERGMVLRPEAIDEILDYRVVLERGASSLAAEHRRAQDLTAMRGTIRAMSAARDLADYRREDSAFHDALSTAARNRRLAEAIQDTRGALFLPMDALRFDLVMETVEEHRAICDAIAARDGALAADLAQAHIESTRRQIQRVLDADR